MIARFLLVTAVVVSFACAGCRKAAVESYRIAKEKDPEMPKAAAPASEGAPSAPTQPASAGDAAMANTPVATAQGANLQWTAPREWKQKSASAMRKGSYSIPSEGAEDGDLAITAFPGDVGGELANVNRWRGQLQLGPIAESELAAAITRVEHNGLKFGIVDLIATGEKPRRILGAYVPHEGSTWFFKLTGPSDLVERTKPAFLEFVKTIKPAAPATP